MGQLACELVLAEQVFFYLLLYLCVCVFKYCNVMLTLYMFQYYISYVNMKDELVRRLHHAEKAIEKTKKKTNAYKEKSDM
jgi:hypothetical protein